MRGSLVPRVAGRPGLAQRSSLATPCNDTQPLDCLFVARAFVPAPAHTTNSQNANFVGVPNEEQKQ